MEAAKTVDALEAQPYRALYLQWCSALGEFQDEPVPDGLEFSPIPGVPIDADCLGVFGLFSWETRLAEITHSDGSVIFREENAEFPAGWRDHDRNIISQKYFFGDHEQGFRETSFKQLVARVSLRIGIWATRRGTFRTAADARHFLNNLIYMQLNQMFAFNSPVYFNVGTDIYGLTPSEDNYIYDDSFAMAVPCPDANVNPQISACFIQSISDDMQSIMRLAVSEAFVFKRGSGTGTDLSPLRSHREKVSGGGRPSGPLSFMRIYDAIAGVVQSGGKTRRAAKMQTLKYDHPDILEFIDAKASEERKARSLIAAGYSGDLNGEAYRSVFFQNCNMSVRVSDDFMNKSMNTYCVVGDPRRSFGTVARTTGETLGWLDAPETLDRIAACAHFCGDPGIQFEDMIQEWHTVPNHSPINSSNPCGEYMHVDDSACNLASDNPLRMVGADGTLDVTLSRAVIDVAIAAMETMVDEGSYPTPEIALNSHRLRPLGLGYCNVGAFVMSRGLAYASDDARAWVASFTHLITARAYRQSSLLARRFGAFEEYQNNKKEMLNVINMHLNECSQIDAIYIRDAAYDDWVDALRSGREHGFRNSQLTCIAPTGTISFMMGAETSGIEPEIALVRYKHLAGRGVVKMVNGMVERALNALGYNQAQISGIMKHIKDFGTVQSIIYEGGAENVDSGVLAHHLDVFDCAFPPARAGVTESGLRWELVDEPRSIHWLDHVRMVAAAQPGVSGAVSKTINMPADATIDDVRSAYIEAWRLGCKSIALYRDGSKGAQPLTTANPAVAVADTAEKGIEAGVPPGLPDLRPVRRRLPATRSSVTHKFSIVGHEGYIHVGLFDDGTPGEVFIDIAKNGSTVGGLMGALGVSLSLALQYGVPVDKIADKLSGHRFEPAGITQNRDIPFATSIIDYIGRWLGYQFIPGYRRESRPVRADGETPAQAFGPSSLDTVVTPPEVIPDRVGTDGTLAFAADIHGFPCPNCGAIMVQQGPCQQCFGCGYSHGGCGG